MPPKVLGTVSSCRECPNRTYASGGQYECSLVREVIPKGTETKVASFCPLPDFPSGKIADLERTIRMLYKPNDCEFSVAMLLHIAARLETVVSKNGICITLKDPQDKSGKQIDLWWGSITKIELYPNYIHFVSGGTTFRLDIDARPPKIEEQILVEGREELFWTTREFA